MASTSRQLSREPSYNSLASSTPVAAPPRAKETQTRTPSHAAVRPARPLLRAMPPWRVALFLSPVLVGLPLVCVWAVQRWRAPRVEDGSDFVGQVPPAQLPLLPPELHLPKQRKLPVPPEQVVTPQKSKSDWETWVERLADPNSPRYLIVDAKNGLGNRLRALCSAISVAASIRRRVLLIWNPDLHCNCSFASLYKAPLPFALLDEEIPRVNLTSQWFQVYNYMRPEPGAIKDEEIFVDPRRHLYFKSGFIMNHYRGQWKFAQRYLQPPFMPSPVEAVSSRLVTDRSMVGLHVRSVFDAPRDPASANDSVGESAIAGAQKEYGVTGTDKLLKWRSASHWSNFVTRMAEMLREHATRYPPPLHPPLRFYLAADSAEAYEGLSARFGDAVKFTRRECGTARCDFRDCDSMLYSLVDMMNLARTKMILGSGYSSYSEVAARMGGTWGRGLPILMAGRDFGDSILPSEKKHAKPGWSRRRARRNYWG